MKYNIMKEELQAGKDHTPKIHSTHSRQAEAIVECQRLNKGVKHGDYTVYFVEEA